MAKRCACMVGPFALKANDRTMKTYTILFALAAFLVAFGIVLFAFGL